VALHTAYKLVLIRAYDAGDMAQIYPIARGSAPLLVAVAAVVLLGEPLAGMTAAGIALLIAGVWLMALRGGAMAQKPETRAVLLAALTACCIAAYTVVDGIAARGAASASSFAVWMFFFDGLAMAAVCGLMRGRHGFRPMLLVLPSGIAGGALSLGAYWIILWAMTQAPLAAVAALRETSVLFALLLSATVLRERPTPWRIACGLLIVIGAATLRLG
jgi:drug/metabolite transporter (DMT)-like permease